MTALPIRPRVGIPAGGCHDPADGTGAELTRSRGGRAKPLYSRPTAAPIVANHPTSALMPSAPVSKNKNTPTPATSFRRRPDPRKAATATATVAIVALNQIRVANDGDRSKLFHTSPISQPMRNPRANPPAKQVPRMTNSRRVRRRTRIPTRSATLAMQSSGRTGPSTRGVARIPDRNKPTLPFDSFRNVSLSRGERTQRRADARSAYRQPGSQ